MRLLNGAVRGSSLASDLTRLHSPFLQLERAHAPGPSSAHFIFLCACSLAKITGQRGKHYSEWA